MLVYTILSNLLRSRESGVSVRVRVGVQSGVSVWVSVTHYFALRSGCQTSLTITIRSERVWEVSVKHFLVLRIESY